MGPSWECRSLGGVFLKNLFCPWSFSLHHLSHFLVHYEINGSPPLCGPRHDLTTYHSLEVTEPGNMGWSHWTHESKQGAFPSTCLSQMFLSQWQKLTQFPTLCPPISGPAFHHWWQEFRSPLNSSHWPKDTEDSAETAHVGGQRFWEDAELWGYRKQQGLPITWRTWNRGVLLEGIENGPDAIKSQMEFPPQKINTELPYDPEFCFQLYTSKN